MQRHQLYYYLCLFWLISKNIVSTNMKTSIGQQRKIRGAERIKSERIKWHKPWTKHYFYLQMWDSNLRDQNLVSFWTDEGGIDVLEMPSWDTIRKSMEVKQKHARFGSKKDMVAPKSVKDAMPVMSPGILNSLLINWHLFKLVSLLCLERIVSIHWIPYSDFAWSLEGNERQVFPADYHPHTLIYPCRWPLQDQEKLNRKEHGRREWLLNQTSHLRPKKSESESNYTNPGSSII